MKINSNTICTRKNHEKHIKINHFFLENISYAYYNNNVVNALVMKLVDIADSKSAGFKPVPVRVRSRAPIIDD